MGNGTRLALAPVLALLLSVSGSSAAKCQDAVTLRWSLAEGQQLNLELEQVTDTVTTVNKYTSRVRLEAAAQLGWRVERVDNDGNMHIEQTLRGVRVKLSSGDQPPVEYDSAKGPAPGAAARQLARSLQPLLDARTRFVLSPRGELSSLPQGDSAAEAGGESAEDPSGVLDTEQLEQLLRQTLVVFPEAPVAVGESWETRSNLPTRRGMLALRSQWTYEGQESDLHRLALAATFTLEQPAKGLKVVQQQTGGTLQFDLQAGRLSSGEIQQTLITESPYRDETVTVRLESQTRVSVRP